VEEDFARKSLQKKSCS